MGLTMRHDFIPLDGMASTPEHRAKHCQGDDYCCMACWGHIERGTHEARCCAGKSDVTLQLDATGYPLRLPGCGEVDNG